MSAPVVDRLAAALDARRPYWSPARRFAIWALAQLAIVAIALRVRPDAIERLVHVRIALEVALLALLGASGAALALRAAVPGRHPGRALTIAAGTLAIGVAVTVLPDVTLAAVVPAGWPCAVKTLLLAAIPWLVLTVALVRGAVLLPLVAGLLAGIAPLAMSAALMRLLCGNDDGMHLLVWHDLPLALGVAASVAVGAWLFVGWARRRV